MFLIQLSELTSLSCHFQGFRLEAKTSHCNRYLLSRDSLSFTARLQYLIIPQRAVEGKSVSCGTVKSLADALFSVVWLVGSGHSIVPGSTGCCVKWFVMIILCSCSITHTHTHTHTQQLRFTLQNSPKHRYLDCKQMFPSVRQVMVSWFVAGLSWFTRSNQLN